MPTLAHPGTVPGYEAGTLDNKQPFYAMQKVEGETLRKFLDTGRDFSSEQTRSRMLEIFERVCQTIAFAHSQGITSTPDAEKKSLNVGCANTRIENGSAGI